MRELSLGTFVRESLSADHSATQDGVYVKPHDWDVSPTSARLYIFEPEEVEELDDLGDLPRIVTEMGLRTLLVTSNLEDVIRHQHRKKPDSSEVDYIAAINHYREYDSFL
jgi:hypothetical protein